MNSHRTPVPQTSFGLIAWLESTRIALPLKGVECRFEVTGAVASVDLDQIYHQDAAQPLDCTYTFPLPAGAAVYRCELHVNGRVIRARVEEAAKAKRIYLEQKAAGHRAALVETERENLFTLSLGNVQPGDLIVVRFAWFQVLDTATEDLRLRVPTCPGVRYIPGRPLLRSASGTGTANDTDAVPDASRITPPRIDALHPDAAYFCLEGRMAASDVESGTVSSPSHAVEVRMGEESVAMQLSGHAAVPDRDFVLTWREAKTATLDPRGWQWSDGRQTYALALLRAPERAPVAEDYAQDVYFLIDRSGSMAGMKWQRTCEALRAFVQELGAEDRVWITLFESEFRDFAEKPLPASQVLRDPGFQGMEALGTTGGTELLPAATHVLEKIGAFSADRPVSVILITDGQVGNEVAIEEAFRLSPQTTVHTFGIDTAVNDAFLRKLARQQRGCCWLQTPNDDIAGTISSLGARLRRPVLTAMRVLPPWEPGDSSLPSLRGGEVAIVPLRSRESGSPTIGIAAQLPDGNRCEYAIPCSAAGSEALKLLWARERIDALLGARQSAEAIAVAKEFNILCAGAAFIAWDEVEQVQVAERSIVQPAMAVNVVDACPPESVLYSMAPSGGAPRRASRDNGLVFNRTMGKFRHHNASRDSAELAKEVSDRILHLRGMLRRWMDSQPWIEALAGAIRGRDAAALQQTEELIGAAELAASLKDSRFRNHPRLSQALARGLEPTTDHANYKLLAWGQAVKNGVLELPRLIHSLDQAGVPVDLADHLLAWAWELGRPNARRLELVNALAEQLKKGSFSTAARSQHWAEFLAKASGLCDEARAMIAELAEPPGQPAV